MEQGTVEETPRADPADVVRSYWQHVWLDRDLDALDDLVTDPSIRNTADGTRELSTADLKALLRDALCAVRGKDMTVDAVAVDGSNVWIRLTLHGISIATMSPLTFTWLAQYRIVDGRIAEAWALHQTGVDWSS